MTSEGQNNGANGNNGNNQPELTREQKKELLWAKGGSFIFGFANSYFITVYLYQIIHMEEGYSPLMDMEGGYMPWPALLLTAVSIMLIGTVWKFFAWIFSDASLKVLQYCSSRTTFISGLVFGILFFILVPTYVIANIVYFVFFIVLLVILAPFLSSCS